MKKVVCFSFYPSSGPSVRHRIVVYKNIWQSQGYSLVMKPFLTNNLYNNRRKMGLLATLYKISCIGFCLSRLIFRIIILNKYDIVIIHREVCPIGGGFFEFLLTKINPVTFYDFDDAIWLPMPLKIDQRKLFFHENSIKNTIKACHGIIAGNQFLANYSQQFNHNVHIIPTPYKDLVKTGLPASKSIKPIIVWIGNVGNEEYLNTLRVPLQKLATTHDFIFRIIGSAELKYFEIEGVHIEFYEWSEIEESKLLLESDIGVMPLFDRDYEKGKCAFKLIQYSSAKLALVASPVGMNQEVIEEGVNGYLPKNETQWQDSLAKLLEDKQIRTTFAENAYIKYQSLYTPEINASYWLDIFSP